MSEWNRLHTHTHTLPHYKLHSLSHYTTLARVATPLGQDTRTLLMISGVCVCRGMGRRRQWRYSMGTMICHFRGNNWRSLLICLLLCVCVCMCVQSLGQVVSYLLYLLDLHSSHRFLATMQSKHSTRRLFPSSFVVRIEQTNKVYILKLNLIRFPA